MLTKKLTFTNRDRAALHQLAHQRVLERRENLLLILSRGYSMTPEQVDLLDQIDAYLAAPSDRTFPEL